MASNDIKDVEKTEHRDGFEDDSQQGDGAPIHWDWMRVGAIMSLAGIYVGMQDNLRPRGRKVRGY